MEIKLAQHSLSKALNYVTRAVSVKPNIPVLSNVLVEVNKTNLHLAATNLDMGINLWIPGQVESEGSLTVSGKLLADFVAATGEGNVVLKQEGDTLKALTDKAQAEFATISAQEFPILPRVSEKPLMKIKSNLLVDALTKVVFACAADVVTSKVQHTGVLWEIDPELKENEVTLVGLDGYRLSLKTIEVTDSSAEEPMKLIVPARPLQELIKILSSEDVEECEIFVNEAKTQIIYRCGEIEVSVRLIEGPYAEYAKVIPADESLSFSVPKADLEHALKVVYTFAKNSQGYRVDWDLDLETTTLTMRSSISQMGQNEVQLKLKDVTGSSDFKGAYSLQFLIELVSHIQGDEVSFATNGPLAAAVFKDSKDKDFLHIIMPLQRD